ALRPIESRVLLYRRHRRRGEIPLGTSLGQGHSRLDLLTARSRLICRFAVSSAGAVGHKRLSSLKTIARSTAIRKAPAIERIAATTGWCFCFAAAGDGARLQPVAQAGCGVG